MKKYLRSGEVLIVAFLVVQGLDGALTYLGLHLTDSREGNIMIAQTMNLIGVVPALYVWKIWTSLLGISIYLLGGRAGFVALGALTVFYIGAGLLPWLWILMHAARH